MAAYRAVDLIRRFRDEGASVTVVMTDASKRFITPLSLATASGSRVYTGLFDSSIAHIDLAREADVLVIAPATANIIGKFASGIADDLLSTVGIAMRGPVLVAPAMNWRMYGNPVLRKNLQHLRAAGVVEIEPEEGRLSCGEEGPGRMAPVERIVEEVDRALSGGDLAGEKIVVTAGPTREYIDDVRFISNPSTGKMGYAVARAARLRGAEVTLISGPTHLEPPAGLKVIRVETASEMRDSVLRSLRGASVLIMAAAVGDFAPRARARGKVDKSALKTLRLERSPDILKEVGSKRKKPFIVGFAAEAGDNLRRAERKLVEKGADIIVFNDVTAKGSGFGTDTNKVTLVEKGGATEYPLLSKDEVAGLILDRVCERRG